MSIRDNEWNSAYQNEVYFELGVVSKEECVTGIRSTQLHWDLAKQSLPILCLGVSQLRNSQLSGETSESFLNRCRKHSLSIYYAVGPMIIFFSHLISSQTL